MFLEGGLVTLSADFSSQEASATVHSFSCDLQWGMAAISGLQFDVVVYRPFGPCPDEMSENLSV